MTHSPEGSQPPPVPHHERRAGLPSGQQTRRGRIPAVAAGALHMLPQRRLQVHTGGGWMKIENKTR